MFDMLVRLYDLPCIAAELEALQQQGITIRRAMAYEKHKVAEWVGSNFSPKWVSECEVAFSRMPVACYIATLQSRIIGFCCHDVTAKGFLGPMGTAQDMRAKGLGKCLLVSSLQALYQQGYAYAVIGGVGPAEFYAKCVGAVPIEGSTPGIYRDILPG